MATYNQREITRLIQERAGIDRRIAGMRLEPWKYGPDIRALEQKGAAVDRQLAGRTGRI